MGLFDGLQNLLGDVTGSAGDLVNNIKDSVPVDGVVDSVTSVTDSLSESAQGLQDTGNAAVEDIKNNLGL